MNDENAAPVEVPLPTKAQLEAAMAWLEAQGIGPLLVAGYVLAVQAREETDEFNDELEPGEEPTTVEATFGMWHEERDIVREFGHEFIDLGQTVAGIIFGEGA